MTLGEGTEIYISIWTLIWLAIFIWRAATFQKHLTDKLWSLEERLDTHEEIDTKNNIAVRLAWIEESLVWIKNKLMN